MKEVINPLLTRNIEILEAELAGTRVTLGNYRESNAHLLEEYAKLKDSLEKLRRAVHLASAIQFDLCMASEGDSPDNCRHHYALSILSAIPTDPETPKAPSPS